MCGKTARRDLYGGRPAMGGSTVMVCKNNMSAENDTPETRLTKYQELYSLSKEIFKEESNRSGNMEKKASIYISMLTFLIGLFGYYGKQFINSLLPPKDLLCWGILLLIAVLFFLSIKTWFHLFKILRLCKYYKMPIPITFFHENDLATVYYGMAKGFEKYIVENRENGDRKGLLLNKSYDLIKIMVVVISIMSIASTTRIWIKNTPDKEHTMAEDQNEKPATQDTSTQNIPNTDVTPPVFVMVQDSATSPRDGATEVITETKED